MSRLVLVPTPIGNLEDITLRALNVLRATDVIAAEDTRHSRKLLTHFGIDKSLVRLDAHTIEQRGKSVLEQYDFIACISDAGTPGISDPGAELVRMALERGDEVEVLPGATAVIPALVLSGLPLGRFAFEGFLPRKGRVRKERLEAIAKSNMTLALYESPHRLVKTLEDLMQICGESRQASVSRELSKRFETTYRGTLKELCDELSQIDIKGEIVMVIAPVDKVEKLDYSVEVEKLRTEGLAGRELRQALIDLGAPRNLAYTLSLTTDDSI